jgi:hypothetical protein
MTEMLERVARAIAKREAEIMMGADRSQMAADPRELARAAMEEMRTLTDDMLAAGRDRPYVEADQNTRYCWGQMINRALGPRAYRKEASR